MASPYRQVRRKRWTDHRSEAAGVLAGGDGEWASSETQEDLDETLVLSAGASAGRGRGRSSGRRGRGEDGVM